MAFYEALRQALRTHAAGVHSGGAPASPADLAQAEERLGQPLPKALKDFLRSWNGAWLFHDSIVLHATNDPGLVRPAAGQVRIGEVPSGGLWMDQAGVIRLVDEAAPDPIVAGTGLERWLAATLAREALVFDRDGEFREVFDPEGELSVGVRRKRAQAGRKHDPEAALYLLEEAELLVEAHEADRALDSLRQAVALDPQAGPAWELLASLLRQAGQAEGAEAAAVQAAAATPAPWLRASRLVDAALSAGKERGAAHAAAAWSADPGHAQALLAEARRSLQEGAGDEMARLSERLRPLAEVAAAAAGAEQAAALQAELADLDRQARLRNALRLA